MSGTVTYYELSAAEIERLTNTIGAICQDEAVPNTVFACVCAALLKQNPDLEPKELGHMIKEISELMALLLWGNDTEVNPKAAN